uniref:G-patch domain-containing protein n=1 Tax=Electrophorus electricus TaxID=8005 RepID=A0A4W4GL31_ELEEL
NMASDGESDEDFVTYGSPLEPLEEDEPIRKPIPVQDQTVKDEKGRYKRFHGAFTGGFSAGYFNTVGSKEGWTPSTFVSSRQQKAERHDARPEDFMDEEDFSEHGIAPREITTTDDFASGRPDQLKDKAQAISSLSAPIPGDTLLEEMITPTRSSIGVQLLRKMGWKDGQGVGPRVKRRQRKQEPDVRAYGCALPPNGSEESENEDEFAPENVTFAPKDVTPVDFTPKDDLHGLGYRGLDPLQALAGHSGMGHINLFTLDSDRSSLFGERKPGQHRKGGIAGQAFGVGAMEEEDDDIYHRDAMSNYDAVLGGEEPGDGLYGWTAPQQYHNSKNDAAYVGKILEGFTLASKGTEVKTVFPPPVLPRDYRPVHYFRPVVDLSSVSPIVAQALQASRGHLSQDAPQQGRHMLDSTQRREMLGETTLQGPSSVFELLDSKDRERLSGIRKAAEDKRALGDMASAAAQLALCACLDLTMTEWERGREREEFVRAAVLYKPSNSSLSSRFTRAKHEDSEDTVEVARDQENDADDKQAAVKMKMFGKLTRETFEWHPDKLLCKRFNVPDPYPGSSVVGMPKVKRDKFSVFNFLTITEDRGGSQSASGSAIGPAPGPTPTATGKRSRWDVTGQEVFSFLHNSPIQPKTTEPVTEQTAKQTEDDDRADEEEVRPPMDLFKAIFASSSDEKSSSSSAEESGEDEEQEAKPQTNEPIAASVNLLAPPVSTVSSSSMTGRCLFRMLKENGGCS